MIFFSWDWLFCLSRKKNHTINYNMLKIMRAFHIQAMIKSKYTRTYLQGEVGCITVNEYALKQSMPIWTKKALTKSNQLEKSYQNQQWQCWCGSTKHIRITTNDFPVGISYQKVKIWTGVWGYIKPIQIRQKNIKHRRRRENVWRHQRMGSSKYQTRGHHQ